MREDEIDPELVKLYMYVLVQGFSVTEYELNYDGDCYTVWLENNKGDKVDVSIVPRDMFFL